MDAKYEEKKNTKAILSDLINGDNIFGIAAYQNDFLVGYLLGEVMDDEVFGKCVYVPYEGIAFADNASIEDIRSIYREASILWSSHGAESEYIEAPSGDERYIKALLHLSFAYQQVYGIKTLTKEEYVMPTNLKIRKANKNDKKDLEKVSSLIYSYQEKAPTYAYLPNSYKKMIRKGYGELPLEEDTTTLLAHIDNSLVGFISASPFIDDAMMIPSACIEISIAGVVEDSRLSHIGQSLVNRLINMAIEEDKKTAIVDYRIANLSSSNFWAKMDFVPVAYRMYRKIR